MGTYETLSSNMSFSCIINTNMVIFFKNSTNQKLKEMSMPLAGESPRKWPPLSAHNLTHTVFP